MEIEAEEEQVATEPPKIHLLEESLVNRIAAGEVIQRPVSAVKELVENSLDARSSSINVVVKDGGLKLIQVSDDGQGIRYEDLPIPCERQPSAFEDLQSIKSMGFRGEALASMTYVAHVTVTTITKGQLHDYSMELLEQMLILFPQHQGLMQFDRCTGVSVARSLMKWKLQIKILLAQFFRWTALSPIPIIVNHRSVDCSDLKRALEVVYAATLPKASKPFIYMSIMLPPEHVDVNVHPNKERGKPSESGNHH
ncbi:DNA mismatch repair protein MLH1-like [Pyrus x bretschneideri]|uniref:DNA mismatch repair protein MLH1-like n=1 Tax=Pyrus x bretschneideri TaxID=225117 RepID=UPI00202F8B4F|nr:DNA mismatch repair protein MLH1-like [Pyrus x bretschneideri]